MYLIALAASYSNKPQPNIGTALEAILPSREATNLAPALLPKRFSIVPLNPSSIEMIFLAKLVLAILLEAAAAPSTTA